MTPSTNITRLVHVINFTRRVYIKVFLPHTYTPGAYFTKRVLGFGSLLSFHKLAWAGTSRLVSHVFTCLPIIIIIIIYYYYILLFLDVTRTSADEFQCAGDLYDAVGAVLHEATENENEDDIKEICTGIVYLLKRYDIGAFYECF